MKWKRIVALCGLLAGLLGCGNKGDLYIPNEAAPKDDVEQSENDAT